MVSLTTPVCDFGWKAPDFDLLGTDGKRHTIASARAENGLLVMFICNHCPYVQAVIQRVIRDVRQLRALGIGAIGIMPNDAREYPEDSFDNMKRVAKDLDLPFPYVLDDTQEVARSYGAVCTPDFFGFDRDLGLQYRGRLDSSGKAPAGPEAKRELFDAMAQIGRTGEGPRQQIPSMGCSIKWKAR